MKNVVVTPEEYKQVLLGLLERIHKVCIENNIRYTIAYGTLLGAVRHGGFIPWDDDIDICMPREEYARFAEAFPSVDGRYYLLDSRSSKNYSFSLYRACDNSIKMESVATENIENFGAFIDIFLQDRWPADTEERRKYHLEYKAAQRRVKYAQPWSAFRTAPLKKKLAICAHIKDRIVNHLIVGLDKRIAEREQLLTRYRDEETGWRNIASRISKWYMREEDLDNRILITFEGLEVYAPKNYDDLLKQHYGDYMKLPPEEKRVKVHNYTPYWREKAGL